jgi:glutamate dehydrogenase/leucine dehydrogenase
MAEATEAGVRPLTRQQLYVEPCDLFMPCALGGGISADRARTSTWRMVCGSANNQLQSPEVERVMLDRDITWAPDVVVSAGAVIEGVLTMVSNASTDEVSAAIDGIADTCATLIEASRASGTSAFELARERARYNLATGVAPR